MNGETLKRAKAWWRRYELWALGALLVLSGGIFGYQTAMYSAHRIMLVELAAIRAAYDQALGKKDQRLEALASQTGKAAEVAATAAQAASDAASKAADAVQTQQAPQ
ncbi:hypothetical protein [Pseudomonas oryzihabitans]|uniref:Lipoprotein n=1 Tax=Pseudomonas oryzihabitans TaxID=47885 RepID=A0ABX3IQN5_9PSED|nr:hypothetical protein [Pseudomonas psychrotolerans]ONN70674.1 hypothetical protein BVL52_20790 [Pseudomonas psychrotolerans]